MKFITLHYSNNYQFSENCRIVAPHMPYSIYVHGLSVASLVLELLSAQKANPK
ncbi:uncharacterized protein MELLADRAFT_91577 [Melampsora larici-populina 98AG31]|uniref:Uncharacterized protein n=1 Tax=Melampsora larici-populina (strain 98AG31 / pathotype 3-4-7) TaxID=747676 RepID=F4RZJ9_MELLP|nr:uncharacterized protein MELLADRAFT_91577 [Melampsora larici-populina 98AG31]EGG02241.1 hypothetical protein MELLADRAFT_91577 [Melampsora larici-populina 98AG31]